MITQQQLIQLVSGTPDNVVYHILTLLLIQASFGIAVAQWRRDPADPFTRRLAVGAAAFLVTRLLFFAAILLTNGSESTALRTLPPVEQALNTLIAVFLVWSLVPPPRAAPRLSNVLLVAATLVVAVMYIFFAQRWAVADPERFYGSSSQASIWSWLQTGLLGVGFLLVLLTGRYRREWILRLMTLGMLLGAQVAQLLNQPVLSPTETEIPYWVRLGHLVVFPLFAIIAYRNSVASLLNASSQTRNNTPADTADMLQRSARVIGASDLPQAVDNVIAFAMELLPAQFIAVGLVSPDDTDDLQVMTRQSPAGAPGRNNWMLNISDWPALRLALKQRHSVHLSFNGLGARQLRDLYDELNVSDAGPLLIEPLITDQRVIGALLLTGAAEWEQWPEADAALAPAVATYAAQTLANSRTIEQLRSTAQRPGDETGDTATLGRLLIAEKDRDAAQARIETLNHLLERAEARARAEEERAESLAEQARLAQAAAVVPPPTPLTQRDATAAELEQEIHTLRESLMHAEEALAIAAADEQGLSADWVMRALTRYSGELEQAQEQIQTLEQQLEIRGTDSKDQTLLAMLDDLRSPITSIVGYSDLLLGEAMGTLGVNQRKFLQRVRGNVERMRGTIGALSALLRADRLFDAEEDDEITDNVADVVDIAIDTVLEQIQERELRLELDVDDRLPPIPVGKETLHQIIAHLLNNACHVSTRNSRIGLTVHAGTLEGEGSENPLRFLQVTVRDHSVGVQPDMLPYIFNQPAAMETPFVPGLTTAHELVVRSGGRIWIDSRLGDGNTFSVLLPIDGKEPQDSRAVTHVNGNGHAV